MELPDAESLAMQEAAGTSLHVIRKEGNLLYFKEHPFPWRGIPSPMAIHAVNKLKRKLRTFKTVHWEKFAPHLLPKDQQQAITRELSRFLTPFTVHHEEIAHIIEYDAAYRLRLQDLLNETGKGALLHEPITELWRLMRVYKKREQIPDVYRKVRSGALLLTAALLWPPFRQKWRNALRESKYENFLPDSCDSYWLSIREDYKTGI